MHADAHETSVTSLLKSQTQAHRDNNYVSTYDKKFLLQNMQNLRTPLKPPLHGRRLIVMYI